MYSNYAEQFLKDKEFEGLSAFTFKDNMKSFERCKNNWHDVSYDMIVKDIETTRNIIFNGEWTKEDDFPKSVQEDPIGFQMDDKRYLSSQNLIDILAKGGVISLPLHLYRIKNKNPKCARCGGGYDNIPVLQPSKYNSSIRICPWCKKIEDNEG